MDTACVELKFANGSMIAIDTLAVENAVDDNMYQRSELDDLIYNDPIGYADLTFTKHQDLSEDELDEVQRMIGRIRKGGSQ